MDSNENGAIEITVIINIIIILLLFFLSNSVCEKNVCVLVLDRLLARDLNLDIKWDFFVIKLSEIILGVFSLNFFWNCSLQYQAMMVSIAYQKLVFFIVADNSFLMKMVIVRTQKLYLYIYYKIYLF